MAEDTRPRPLLPLRLEGVTYAVNGRVLLERVSAVLAPGPRTVILGANGAGKSLLMRICHGLIQPTGGSVHWSAAETPGRPRRQAMLFQRPVMLRRSVQANVTYALALAGVPRSERSEQARAALARVGLADLAHRPARVLSVGEQQRLAFARAWALEPEVLFLDEPTASLDPGATRDIETLIGAIHQAGTKVVMITHNLGQARRIADEIIFLHQGRLLEQTAVDRFFKQPETSEAAAFIRDELPWT